MPTPKFPLGSMKALIGGTAFVGMLIAATLVQNELVTYPLLQGSAASEGNGCYRIDIQDPNNPDDDVLIIDGSPEGYIERGPGSAMSPYVLTTSGNAYGPCCDLNNPQCPGPIEFDNEPLNGCSQIRIPICQRVGSGDGTAVCIGPGGSTANNPDDPDCSVAPPDPAVPNISIVPSTLPDGLNVPTANGTATQVFLLSNEANPSEPPAWDAVFEVLENAQETGEALLAEINGQLFLFTP